MLNPIAKGISPKIVVAVVNKIGLNLCLQVFITTSSLDKLGNSSFRRLKVSINTMLLFTTIPDRATMAIPVIVVLNGLPVINNPISTPTIDIKTALKTNVD